MSEKNISNFVPKEGQVDFSNIRWAPVVNIVVMFENKILLLKRNENLNFYPGFWNGVSGFLDDNLSLEEKVKEELFEEIGIGEDNIDYIKLCGVFDKNEPKYKKTWIMHAVLVKIKSNNLKLDWETSKYVWVTEEEIGGYDLLPGFDSVLELTLDERV